MALLDSQTFAKMESMLYQQKHVDKKIALRREELLTPHKGGDANRGYRSKGATSDPIAIPVARVESDPVIDELRRQKAAVDRTLDYFKLDAPEKHRLIIMRYYSEWSPRTIQRKLNIGQTTFQTWRLEVLNYLHKACIDGRLLDL